MSFSLRNIGTPPNWNGRPSIRPVIKLPVESFGMPLSWEDDFAPDPVFLGQFVHGEADIYLFATKFPYDKTTERLFDGSGFFQEYTVLRRSGDADDSTYHLRQHLMCMFTEKTGIAEPRANEIRNQLRDTKTPNWKWSDALWPHNAERPMEFLGQVTIPPGLDESEESVFLFVDSDQPTCFAVFVQESNYQSAEEHYANE